MNKSGSHIISKIITDNFNKGTCVGLDSRSKSRDGVLQYGYYIFYLSQFRVTRMQPDEWLNKCDGPFLTYDTKFVKNMNKVKVVAQELDSGLYIVMREKDINLSLGYPYISREYAFIKYFIDGHPGCKVKGCMDWNASSGDPSFTKVGEYRDGGLNTTGHEGYLFIGPKVSVNSDGIYMIRIKGDFRKLDSTSRLKVTSNDGKTINRLAILDQEPNNHEIVFQLNQPVDDLQIMIYVGKDADISLNSYEVTAYSYR
jgi:hypothetical protein